MKTCKIINIIFLAQTIRIICTSIRLIIMGAIWCSFQRGRICFTLKNEKIAGSCEVSSLQRLIAKKVPPPTPFCAGSWKIIPEMDSTLKYSPGEPPCYLPPSPTMKNSNFRSSSFAWILKQRKGWNFCFFNKISKLLSFSFIFLFIFYRLIEKRWRSKRSTEQMKNISDFTDFFLKKILRQTSWRCKKEIKNKNEK